MHMNTHAIAIKLYIAVIHIIIIIIIDVIKHTWKKMHNMLICKHENNTLFQLLLTMFTSNNNNSMYNVHLSAL